MRASQRDARWPGPKSNRITGLTTASRCPIIQNETTRMPTITPSDNTLMV